MSDDNEMYEDEPTEEVTSREAQEEAAKADMAHILELRMLIKIPGMRRFLWRLLTQCGIGGGFFDGDRDWHLIADGKRRVGHWALAELEKADPTVYAHMLVEQGKEQ